MVENLVVISYWSGRSIEKLQGLIKQIEKIDAGAVFDILIVCNGKSKEVENFIFQSNLSVRCQVISRPNSGYNLGAWDYGWRHCPHYRHFLFLQDDCLIFRKNWLKIFIDKFQSNPQIGLLGESINWKKSWQTLANSDYNNYHREHVSNGQKMRRIDLYRAYLAKNSIPEGINGDHLQSLILFTSKSILELVNGFPLGESYGEAIASEIAISKKIQAAGYHIDMVKPNSCFHYIGHPQWLKRRKKIQQLLFWIENLLFSVSLTTTSKSSPEFLGFVPRWR